MEDRERVPGSSDFGTLLRRHRLAAGLSQEALAERARMSANGIGALERGDRRTPQRETLVLLIRALALDEQQRREFEAAAAHSGSPRRVGGASVTVGPWSDAAISNLPLALKSFVGRESELEEITALVRDHRLVTLAGAGGLGKTETALQVGRALNDGADTAVCFAALAPLSDPSLVVAAIASALGVQRTPSRPLLETLVAHLKNKTLLLILDNCEHVIKQAAEVAENILSGCAHVRILATSRESLRAAGEQSYRLPSLSVPAPEAARGIRATDAGAYGAMVLFTDRARAVDHRFALTDENAPTVADLCRHLDGIPLAIELAAARVNQLSPKALVKRIGDRFRILTGGARTALPRQQTMRATIDWSYDLLEERERLLFRRLGIFVNGFMLDGAVAVGSGQDFNELDVFDLLASLVDKSLVLAEPHGDALRYRLLESTRAYAAGKLDDAGERDLVAHRHLRYLCDHFEVLGQRSERSAPKADLAAALQTELADVRSALDGALSDSDLVDGAKLLADIDWSWQTIGLEAEGMARCEAYLAGLAEDESRLRARLSITLSVYLASSGHKVRAFELAMQAVEHARASNDELLIARALRQYAKTAVPVHRFEDAERALTQAEATPGISVYARSVLLDARAIFSWFRGDLETAARVYEQLRKEHRSVGNTLLEHYVIQNLAEIEYRRGQTQRAIAIVRETLPMARSEADENLLDGLLLNLAGYLAAVDDLPGAVAAARERIEIRAAHEPDHVHVAVAIENLALVFALRSDRTRAAILEGYADAALQRHGFEREFTEMTTYNRLITLLREGLAPDELARLNAEGAALTHEAAIALALEEHEPS